MPNARFFHYVNGDICKLTLQVGETLHHHSYQPTDEGFSAEAIRYSFDGETLTCETYARGRDCDGLHEHFSTAVCSVAKLKAGYFDDEYRINYPAWENTEARQRDHTAEAMNY